MIEHEELVGCEFVEQGGVMLKRNNNFVVAQVAGGYGTTIDKEPVKISRLLKALEEKRYVQAKPGFVYMHRGATVDQVIALCHDCFRKRITRGKKELLFPWGEITGNVYRECEDCGDTLCNQRVNHELVAEFNRKVVR